MDPNSSLGKVCLGENVVEISSDKVKRSRDCDSLEYEDTANNGGKKETKAMVFHKIDTKEVSDRFVAPYFVNRLEAYDGEIKLKVEENMISNEYAVKLCLEHEVKRGNKIAKKGLIVSIRGEIYFVKFIINPDEDDVEPGVIFGRSFLCMSKGITDFGAGTITIYPDIDPFVKDTKEEEKSMDDWDQLLDFNLDKIEYNEFDEEVESPKLVSYVLHYPQSQQDDIPLLGQEELPLLVCKMGKSSCNKKRAIENLNLFYQDIGTSSSTQRHLTQKEAAKEVLALRISQKFALLDKVRPVIETMAYHDKYKKVLDEIWKDKVELDGMIVKEEEEAIKKVKGEALKEKDDPKAFIFPIRLEGQVNENALVDTGSDINTMPFRIYKKLGREEMKKVDRGIIMINHTQVKAMGILMNVLCQVGVTTLITKFLILDIPINRDVPKVVGRGFLRMIGGIVNTPKRLFLTFDGFFHQIFLAARSDVMRNTESDSNDEEEYEIKRNNWEHRYMEETMLMPDHRDPNALDNLKPWKNCCFHKFIMNSCYEEVATMRQSLEIDDMSRIKLCEAESNEEIFTSMAWIRAFNIKEPIYVELCHKFYPTYEFDKGGLRSDDHFNAQDYWLGISREENLGLSISHTSTIWNSILRNDLLLLSMFDAGHQNGYANVAWLIARWIKRKGAGTQKESQICCGQFMTKISRKARVLTNVVLRSLSALIYCRDLDTTTLRELIDSEGILIPEDP
uniref:Uncharacterized protein n=1 Tax=Tanacetum cinerariifolium TaxID=118510 RepID=A0A6L2MT27_TANCI|nr:hypothetical protein [Tanacetum cinerariifolium]